MKFATSIEFVKLFVELFAALFVTLSVCTYYLKFFVLKLYLQVKYTFFINN